MITAPDNRFRYLEIKVGIFVTTALLGVVGVVLYIGIENDLFSATYGLRLTAPKGTGFSQGMPIKLSGFRIGRVKSVTLNDSAAVDVVLQIDRKYRKWMRRDSVAKLIKEGMIGDYIIEISSGTSLELIPENGEIALEKTKPIEELAEEIADKVKPVLLDIRDIIAYVNDSNGDIKQTLRKLNSFSGNLEITRRHADSLLTGSRQLVTDSSQRVDAIMAKSEARLDQMMPLLQKADRSLEQIDRSLPLLLGRAGNTMNNLETLSADLSRVTATALPQLPPLLDKTSGLIDDGAATLEGVNRIWPLSSATDRPASGPLLKGDSHE